MLIQESACHEPAEPAGAVSRIAEPEPRASVRAESEATGESQAVESPRGLQPATHPVRIPIDIAEADRWLFAEKVREGAAGAWATGSFDPGRNKLDIRTRDLRRFAIDLSRIPINWERPVVIGINGANSELRRRDYSVLHFQLDDHGQWVVIEP